MPRRKPPPPLPPPPPAPPPDQSPDGDPLAALARIQAAIQQKLAERNPPPLELVNPLAPGLRHAVPTMSRREQLELTALLAERASRQKEALRIYRPFETAAEFHRSMAGIRLARGSNRGGKTLAASIELARAVTGQDPHGKYPKVGRVIVVGKDLLHCSKVIYRKLFKPGAFKILRDPQTLEWRPFVPDEDAELAHLVEDAPPLIAPRFYDEKKLSWEDKREEVLRSARFKTGWEMTMFSGEGQPPNGWDVDLILFDEEIPHPGWYSEMVPRLVDRGGRHIWSFTPQVGTVVAYELHQRAQDEKGDPNPRVEDFYFTIEENPYISRAAKDQFHKDLEYDEEELRVRYYGDFALKGLRVYPEFVKGGPHRIKPFPIPDDWMRAVAIDPGRRVAAALLIAVPPPGCPILDRPVVYREVYSKQSTAGRFAQELKHAIGPGYVKDWLIDHMHGRKVMESGVSIEQLYADEFRKTALDQNGFNGFIWAASDIAAGKLAAKGKLQIIDGGPGWYFMVENLPWFCWEIERYIDKRITRGGHVVDDVSRSNLHNHLMDCWRYLAMHNLAYRKPPAFRPKKNWVLERLEARRRRRAAETGWGDSIRLG